MSSSGAKKGGDGIEKKSVVNYYLNSVMAPPKTLRFNEGVFLVEDVEAPNTKGSMEERLRKLEEDTHHLAGSELSCGMLNIKTMSMKIISRRLQKRL
jgi:hypothetical protein